ncbi:hypothetical protein [Burkholderia vietnamiensis]|uniref:hypothetical protein n=1 Tax=Burkholderia vietnamiensis TaxID=60552 RepID=UPI000754F5FE|nr:hypothetical protein [Burkholderia vietnamiensis]
MSEARVESMTIEDAWKAVCWVREKRQAVIDNIRLACQEAEVARSAIDDARQRQFSGVELSVLEGEFHRAKETRAALRIAKGHATTVLRVVEENYARRVLSAIGDAN